MSSAAGRPSTATPPRSARSWPRNSGIPQVTYFEKLIDLSDRTIRVRRNVGNGWEVLEARLPLLLTVLDSANEPRPAAAKRVMKYKRTKAAAEITASLATLPDAQKEAAIAKEIEAAKMKGLFIEQWNLDDIAADLRWCGVTGSPTKVHRVQSIVLTKEGFTAIEPTEAGVAKMVHELIVDHTLG